MTMPGQPVSKKANRNQNGNAGLTGNHTRRIPDITGSPTITDTRIILPVQFDLSKKSIPRNRSELTPNLTPTFPATATRDCADPNFSREFFRLELFWAGISRHMLYQKKPRFTERVPYSIISEISYRKCPKFEPENKWVGKKSENTDF